MCEEESFVNCVVQMRVSKDVNLIGLLEHWFFQFVFQMLLQAWYIQTYIQYVFNNQLLEIWRIVAPSWNILKSCLPSICMSRQSPDGTTNNFIQSLSFRHFLDHSHYLLVVLLHEYLICLLTTASWHEIINIT